MKIVAFSNCPLDPLLGSGQTRLAWSKGLESRGHDVTVWDTDRLLPNPDRIRGRRFQIGWGAVRALTRIDLATVDLVEFYGIEFWLPTWWLARRPERKRPLLVAHTDGLELACSERMAASASPAPPGNFFHRKLGSLSTLAFRRTDAFVTASAADREFATRHAIYPEDRMAVIPLGLMPEYLAASDVAPSRPEREERITFLGSWIPRKGAGWVVAVVGPLLEARPNLRLSLLGVGTEESRIRSEFPPGVQDRLEVRARLTPAENIETLRRTKVFLLPTEYEGFGLAVAEAMAIGCAVVSTPTGFAAGLRHEEEAMICPFGDGPAFSRSLTHLLDDDGARIRIASAGQKRARQLHWENSVGQLEATYEKWLGEKRRRCSAAR